jgi:hypothetical protein
MTLNHFHQNDAANSRAWGLALAGAIELALAEIERTHTIDPASACCVAEAIIENCAGEDAHLDGAALYAGALEGSPRYRAASLAWARAQVTKKAEAA